jgi:hypothetical protein
MIPLGRAAIQATSQKRTSIENSNSGAKLVVKSNNVDIGMGTAHSGLNFGMRRTTATIIEVIWINAVREGARKN